LFSISGAIQEVLPQGENPHRYTYSTSKSIKMNGESSSLPVGAIQDYCENAFHFFSLKAGVFGWKCLDNSCD
jgi:hypothetical protein